MKLDGFSNIKLDGFLCEGILISLGWPGEEEYDLITNLRNKDEVRKYFFDSRKLNINNNRYWLEKKIKKPYESILCIRFKKNNLFLGTIGWDKWDPNKKTIEIGRLMLEKNNIRKIIKLLPKNYPGIIMDACLTLRDYAFSKLKVNKIFANYKTNNILSKNVVYEAGSVYFGQKTNKLNDGSCFISEMVEISKKHWNILPKHKIKFLK